MLTVDIIFSTVRRVSFALSLGYCHFERYSNIGAWFEIVLRDRGHEAWVEAMAGRQDICTGWEVRVKSCEQEKKLVMQLASR